MMAEKYRKNVIVLKEVDEDQTPPLLVRRAVKALDRLCDAASSPAAKSNGLSEDEIINAIKKLKPQLDQPEDRYQHTPVWNISSKQDLDQVGLNLTEIEGLACLLSFGESSGETNASDQLIPEILFTLEILDYDEDKFRQFMSHLDGFPAVGVLLCEILTDSKLLEKARQFLDRESTDQKREILLDYVKTKLPYLNNIEIVHFASSCGQYIPTIVPKEIGSMWLKEDSDAPALARVISHSSVVESLNLCSSGLNSKSIASLQDGLKNCGVKIRSLNISYNRDIGEEGFRCLGNIVKKHEVEELDMSNCALSFRKLKSFDDTSGNAKICSLNISENENINEEGFRFLGNIVKKHTVEELDMSICGLSFGKLKSFDDTSGNAKLHSLDISGNEGIEEEGFRLLGNIVKKHAVEELNMSKCALSFGKMKSFDNTSGSAKIHSLNISCNRDIDEEGFRCLGNTVKKHAVEELNMSECDLSFGKLKSFDDASGNAKIRSLDISRNMYLDEEGFHYLGSIVKKHAVEKLNMSLCGYLSFGKLRSFNDASENAKIKVLDISYNDVDEVTVSEICQLAPKVTDLLIAYCDFSCGILDIWSEEDLRELQNFIHTHNPEGLKVALDGHLPELRSELTSEEYLSDSEVIEYLHRRQQRSTAGDDASAEQKSDRDGRKSSD